MTEKNQFIQKANTLGTQARKDSRKPVPAHDPQLLELIRESPGYGTSEALTLDLLDAWLQAWHKENLTF